MLIFHKKKSNIICKFNIFWKQRLNVNRNAGRVHSYNRTLVRMIVVAQYLLSWDVRVTEALPLEATENKLYEARIQRQKLNLKTGLSTGCKKLVLWTLTKLTLNTVHRTGLRSFNQRLGRFSNPLDGRFYFSFTVDISHVC